jgi:hypothetical protein
VRLLEDTGQQTGLQLPPSTAPPPTHTPVDDFLNSCTRAGRFSLLAALCRAQLWPSDSAPEGAGAGARAGGRATAPLPRSSGTFFIDRDWWLFRHVLAFLRSGALPDSEDLLQQLYAESSYYHLTTLRSAVEARYRAMHGCVGVGVPFPPPGRRFHHCYVSLCCHELMWSSVHCW